MIDLRAISQEDYEYAKSNEEISLAQVEVAKQQLLSTLAAIGNYSVDNHPIVENAKEKLKTAYLNLKRCVIRAPISGFIAKRTVQVGHFVNRGTPLMAIIPLDQIWVDANFKETQLEKIRLGQPVTMKSDLWGNTTSYSGKIASIGMGTGSAFALLPPQNATGNWIKVVQRVPVRIVLESDTIKKYPLRIGLSMRVSVDISNPSGNMLLGKRLCQPVFDTDIYENLSQEVESFCSDISRKLLADNNMTDLHDKLSSYAKPPSN